MKTCFASILAWTLLAPCLPAQIATPSPGFVRYPGQPVERLYGVAGNLVPAPAPFGPAGALSFSDSGGLLAVNGRLELVRTDGIVASERTYSGITPVLNIESGFTGAIAWLPETHVLLWWNGKAFTETSVDPGVLEGELTSVSFSAPNVARFLETYPDGSVASVQVSLPDGSVRSSDVIPGIRGPAFQFGSSLIWRDERGLELRTTDGTSTTLPCPAGIFTAERMSSQWVHLFFPSDRTHWALHLAGDESTLSRVPPAPGAKVVNR